MKKIIFITSGKIQYQLPDLTLYESMYQTGMGKNFPHIEDKAISDIEQKTSLLKTQNITTILSAPSNQAKETADIISKNLNVPVIIDDNLLPLTFSLRKLISKDEFEKLGDSRYTIIREKFLNAFLNNELAESNRNLASKFNKLKNFALSSQGKGVILAVSHAYLIKLFEVYALLGNEIFSNKEKVTQTFSPTHEPLKRLETIEIMFER